MAHRVVHRVAPYLVNENCSQSCQPAQEPDNTGRRAGDLAVREERPLEVVAHTCTPARERQKGQELVVFGCIASSVYLKALQGLRRALEQHCRVTVAL